MKHKKYQSGFTLIEVMIVVVIIAVLSSIAYPSYKESVARSRRAEARVVLTAAQQWMERFYTENFRYDRTSDASEQAVTTLFPDRLKKAPAEGSGAEQYVISVIVTNGVRDKYEVRATRKSGSSMANDRCGDFEIDHLGRKRLLNTSGFSSTSAAMDTCWK